MRVFGIYLSLMILLLCVMLLAASCTLSSTNQKYEANIALVIDTHDLESDDFNKNCINGAEKAKNDLGISFEYGIANTNDQYYEVQKRYAELKKYALIICVGGTQVEALNKTAAQFPKQRFALIDAAVDKPNVISIQFRDEQSSYLAGALAAQVTKRGKLGFIGGMDIPVIHRYFAGFYAGSKYIKKDIAGIISYVGSWSDTLKGNNIAMTQVASGADIIFSAAGVSSLGVIEAAKTSNFSVIGTDSDQRYRAPDNVLVSTLKRVDIAVFDVISSTVKGRSKAGTLMYGLKENGVGISLDNALPVVNDQIKKKITEIEAKIISGDIVVPVQ